MATKKPTPLKGRERLEALTRNPSVEPGRCCLSERGKPCKAMAISLGVRGPQTGSKIPSSRVCQAHAALLRAHKRRLDRVPLIGGAGEVQEASWDLPQGQTQSDPVAAGVEPQVEPGLAPCSAPPGLRVHLAGALGADSLDGIQGQPGVILVGSQAAVAAAGHHLYQEVELIERQVPPLSDQVGILEGSLESFQRDLAVARERASTVTRERDEARAELAERESALWVALGEPSGGPWLWEALVRLAASTWEGLLKTRQVLAAATAADPPAEDRVLRLILGAVPGETTEEAARALVLREAEARGWRRGALETSEGVEAVL